MIEVEQSDYRVDSECDLHTCGLGPCVGIVVGYQGRVSMLHAPMPDAGGAENFFSELCDAIPERDRSAIHPVLAGALSDRGHVASHLAKTRKWVEAELKRLGFGPAQVYWGDGGIFACHNLTTDIKAGTVEITHHELADDPKIFDTCPLW